MEFDVVLERNPGSGIWIAKVPGVLGCFTQGASRDEALANIREVLQLLKETGELPTALQVEFAKIRFEA